MGRRPKPGSEPNKGVAPGGQADDRSGSEGKETLGRGEGMAERTGERGERPGQSVGSPAEQHPDPSDGGGSPSDRISPSSNDGVTIGGAICAVCGRAFRRSGRRRFCSDACRQAAWRHRHAGPAPLPPLETTPRSRRSGTSGGSARHLPTVYECPSCGTRYLGEQRCPDCQLFCRRVGPGGLCPHCDEPVAVVDLVGHQGGDATGDNWKG